MQVQEAEYPSSGFQVPPFIYPAETAIAGVSAYYTVWKHFAHNLAAAFEARQWFSPRIPSNLMRHTRNHVIWLQRWRLHCRRESDCEDH